jgi:hypothetical protein
LDSKNKKQKPTEVSGKDTIKKEDNPNGIPFDPPKVGQPFPDE